MALLAMATPPIPSDLQTHGKKIMSKNANQKTGSNRQPTAMASIGKIPRINFIDVSSFHEYQERANYFRQFSGELATAKNDPDGVLVFSEVSVKAALLNRVEEHVKSAGPIFIANGAITSWDAKDLVFWNSLDKDEAVCAAEILVILWVLGCIDLHCPKLVKEAA
jgi:hypothetical protein